MSDRRAWEIPKCVKALIQPIPTEGGPANPAKKGFFLTFWSAIEKEDDLYATTHRSAYQWSNSKILARFQAQQHRFPDWVSKAERKRKGQINVDPYRVIIKTGEPYWAVATSNSQDEIIECYRYLINEVKPEFEKRHPDWRSWPREQLMKELFISFAKLYANFNLMPAARDALLDRSEEWLQMSLEEIVEMARLSNTTTN